MYYRKGKIKMDLIWSIPQTGEKPLSGWIIALIVVAALALLGALFFPQLCALYKKIFKK